MKKLCFVYEDINSIGGLQRVTTNILNGLVESGEYDVSLLLTEPRREQNKYFYNLDPRIKIIRNSSIEVNNNSYGFIERLLMKINHNIYKFKNKEFLKRIYFPHKTLKAFELFFKQREFDVLIGITPRYAAIIELTDTKSVHVGWFHNTFERYFETPKNYQYRQDILYAEILQKLDNIVVLTDGAKKTFDKNFSLNVNRIYNPVAFQNNKLNKLENERIIFVGRLYEKTKGLLKMVEIIDYISKLNPKFELLIVGDGPDREKLVESLSQKKLLNYVKFIKETKDVEHYYEQSSVCIVPSSIEGFGLVVTEAMECGLPVVSFKTEGPSEIINDGVNGFLIDNFDTEKFANKVSILLDNKELRQKMGKEAKRRADDFKIDNIISEWKSLLNNNNQN